MLALLLLHLCVKKYYPKSTYDLGYFASTSRLSLMITYSRLSSWKQVWKLENKYPWLSLNMNKLQGFVSTLNFLLCLDWSEVLRILSLSSVLQIQDVLSPKQFIFRYCEVCWDSATRCQSTCEATRFCRVHWFCLFSLQEQINTVFDYIFLLLLFQGNRYRYSPLTDPLSTDRIYILFCLFFSPA